MLNRSAKSATSQNSSLIILFLDINNRTTKEIKIQFRAVQITHRLKRYEVANFAELGYS
ncbi:hypothetical protein SAMN03097699_2782 [Flavobacteriaceae bacterium MAR_2010_188]|nr:hypothetical protein SAMN03097699_2782 [Flavobacteriaceae bacterium MAR_2010_188]